MPIDLDDMFTTLGRHADTIPLAPPERARRRGRQRTRTLVAAAAAVCLIATGVGALVRHERQGAQVTSERELPTVGAPIEFGDQARVSTAVGADGRLYTAWQTADGRLSVNAVDLRTGTVAWTVPQIADRPADTFFLSALPQALTLTLTQGSEGQAVLVLDPADGRQRWSLTSTATHSLISHESGLIRVTTGRTEAFDWVTGARRWQQPADPADPPVQTVGTYLDQNEGFLLGRPFVFTDNRLVQVTRAGKVQVRDITDGKLLRTVTAAPPDRDPRTYLAYDGWLYNDEHECCGENGYRIRATDLRSDQGGSTVVFTRGPGYRLTMLQMCGELRVCVTDQGRTGPATVSVLDLTTGRQLWSVEAPRDGASASSVHGYTLVGGSPGGWVVHDRAGRPVRSLPETSVNWLDTDKLLVLPSFTPGTASKVTLPDGRVTPLGELPPPSDACAWTPQRLACPIGTSLRIWDISG